MENDDSKNTDQNNGSWVGAVWGFFKAPKLGERLTGGSEIGKAIDQTCTEKRGTIARAIITPTAGERAAEAVVKITGENVSPKPN